MGPAKAIGPEASGAVPALIEVLRGHDLSRRFQASEVLGYRAGGEKLSRLVEAARPAGRSVEVGSGRPREDRTFRGSGSPGLREWLRASGPNHDIRKGEIIEALTKIGPGAKEDAAPT